MTTEKELAFEERIKEAIEDMKEIKYKPLRLERMLDRGAVETVKELMLRDTPPSGFTKLWKEEHLKYSLEYIVAYEPQWAELFGADYEKCKANATKRLSECGYKP